MRQKPCLLSLLRTGTILDPIRNRCGITRRFLRSSNHLPNSKDALGEGRGEGERGGGRGEGGEGGGGGEGGEGGGEGGGGGGGCGFSFSARWLSNPFAVRLGNEGGESAMGAINNFAISDLQAIMRCSLQHHHLCAKPGVKPFGLLFALRPRPCACSTLHVGNMSRGFKGFLAGFTPTLAGLRFRCRLGGGFGTAWIRSRLLPLAFGIERNTDKCIEPHFLRPKSGVL